jgi:hypothetical protein
MARNNPYDSFDPFLTFYPDLQGATLKGARYNDQTIFPKGFNPEANGLIYSMQGSNSESPCE